MTYRILVVVGLTLSTPFVRGDIIDNGDFEAYENAMLSTDISVKEASPVSWIETGIGGHTLIGDTLAYHATSEVSTILFTLGENSTSKNEGVGIDNVLFSAHPPAIPEPAPLCCCCRQWSWRYWRRLGGSPRSGKCASRSEFGLWCRESCLPPCRLEYARPITNE